VLNTISGADWLLIDSDEECEVLRPIRRASPSESAIIIGPSNDRKMRLARLGEEIVCLISRLSPLVPHAGRVTT
jgi:hypothetical protein